MMDNELKTRVKLTRGARVHFRTPIKIGIHPIKWNPGHICKMYKKREHKKEMQFSDSYIFGHNEELCQLTIIGILGMTK